MTGWKTWVAGLGLLFSGGGTILGGIIPALSGDLVGVDWATVQGGITQMGLGLAAIGLGH
ncbi:hypothetical protein LCGC14_2695810, partial [marine sediment metagenome]